jgi:hypothetical protein
MPITSLPNLRKASIAKRWWQNQTGQVTFNETLATKHYSVNGMIVDNNTPALYHLTAPLNETTLGRALRLNLLDRWTMHVRFLFTGGQSIEYSGVKAAEMYEVWKGIVYNNKKG